MERVAAAGVVAMRAQDALRVGFAEHADLPGAGNRLVAAADWADVQAVISAVGHGPLLERVPAHGNPEPDDVEAAVPPPVGTDPSDEDRSEGPASLSERVRIELGQAMGISAVESLDSAVPLVALGLDSLQALDFRKRVQARLNRELPVAAILGGASLDDVVRLMAGSAA
jgi:mycobactin polyketide synthetase MbtD